MNTQEHIRSILGAIRLKNFPLSDLIPLLQRAADELDKYEPYYWAWLQRHAPHLIEPNSMPAKYLLHDGLSASRIASANISIGTTTLKDIEIK